jgi:phospholipid/cholesterol/gamma-HCH transport system substrate-binding protein
LKLLMGFASLNPSYELAEDFDKRSGLLMADGRRTLGDISRAVNNLDRNPTRLLFGAGNSSAQAPPPAAAPATERKRQ